MTSNETLQAEAIRDRINELLLAKPETGEHWAEICRLEQDLADLDPPPEYDAHKDHRHPGRFHRDVIRAA